MNCASDVFPDELPALGRTGSREEAVPDMSAMRTGATPQADASGHYRLWVTGADGELSVQSCWLIAMVDNLRLARVVRVCYEAPDANLAFLQACVDTSVGVPQPYLERVVGGCSAGVMHYLGNDLAEQLRTLAADLQRCALQAN